jgi:hypothetical protein
MALLVLVLLFFVFSIGQIIMDNGVGAVKDHSFWLIILSVAGIVSFMAGKI